MAAKQRFTVVIGDDGGFALFAQDGTPEQGKQNIEVILAALQAAGIEIPERSEVENHRDDPGFAKLHDMAHAAGGHHHH